MAFVSSIGFVSAQTSDTTRTLHVDMANGHSFDIPYSISGATVTDVKADTSIPKMTISISANADGQITLQVPGGDNNSANQNDFAVLVDGQNSQYTQFFDNGHRMVTILFHSTSPTIDLVGQHTKRDIQNVQYKQTSTHCSQDEIQNATQGIDTLSEK